MPAPRGFTCRLLALAVALGLLGAAQVGANPVATQDEGVRARCFARIALFDEIVISRFDYRLLAIERWQLKEARALRRRAEADCRAGRTWFGIGKISDALILIGVPPSLGRSETGEDPADDD